MMQVRTETPIRFTSQHDAHLGHEAESAIVRIVQEALTNANKYARATALTVTLAETDGEVVVTVEDDGIGFDPAASVAAPIGGGLGLRSMRERAAAAGLRLQVWSAPGAGTRITVAVARR
jgi:two-component system NarL family sensor kinase